MEKRVTEHYSTKIPRCGEDCDVYPLPLHALQFKEGRRIIHDAEKCVCAHRSMDDFVPMFHRKQPILYHRDFSILRTNIPNLSDRTT